METAERIVNSYCNYVKGWATIQNIQCQTSQNEIDILAIDPNGHGKKRRYHIEVSVHIRRPFSNLTAEPFSLEKLQKKGVTPKQRMTIGFFIERKFGQFGVKEELSRYGFKPGNHMRVIVCDGWTDGVTELARCSDIELWKFNDILHELSKFCRKSTKHYGDDTLRTVQLLLRAQEMNPGEGSH